MLQRLYALVPLAHLNVQCQCMHTCFYQIASQNASRSLRVFQNDGMEVLSVDVSTSTDAVYSGNTLTITTSTPFFTVRMYYLLADSGVCVCMCLKHWPN